jgi:NAD(P)-dependent dehydrogenase (short-subunit alcohol dehydrogenase family)
MLIADKTVLVTGANRGVGRALVTEALNRGARRVYAAARQPSAHPDERVTPLVLDLTNAAQVREAAEVAASIDVLVNNAGLALYEPLSDREALERQIAVNLLGTYDVTQAFLPSLIRARGAIVTISSLAAWGAIPVLPGYSMTKAAAFSMSQVLRADLARHGVRVHAAVLGPVDTEMVAALDIPKSSPESVASGVFDGVEKDEDDIFPDPLSQTLADGWRGGAVKALELQNAQFTAATP